MFLTRRGRGKGGRLCPLFYSRVSQFGAGGGTGLLRAGKVRGKARQAGRDGSDLQLGYTPSSPFESRCQVVRRPKSPFHAAGHLILPVAREISQQLAGMTTCWYDQRGGEGTNYQSLLNS